jgi:hypothetical protein
MDIFAAMLSPRSEMTRNSGNIPAIQGNLQGLHQCQADKKAARASRY